MRNLLLTVFTFSFLWIGSAVAGIEEKGNKITLQYQGVPLGDIVSEIQKKTGINFVCPDRLKTIPQSVSIHSTSWKDAVKELIKNFNRVENWTDDLSGSHVWLLGEGSDQSTKSPEQKQDSNSTRKADIPAKQKEVASVKRPPPLPQNILLDPGVLNYLISKNVELPPEFLEKYKHRIMKKSPIPPIPPNVLRDPAFQDYINQMRLEPPEQ